MEFSVQKKAIRVVIKNDQDAAYFEDTLGIKGDKATSISGQILENVVVVLHQDTFGNPIYIEICSKIKR